ncbi:MAG: hypothetical protein P8Y76_00550 [bacterium]
MEVSVFKPNNVTLNKWFWGGLRAPGLTVTRVIVRRVDDEFSGNNSWRDVTPEFENSRI